MKVKYYRVWDITTSINGFSNEKKKNNHKIIDFSVQRKNIIIELSFLRYIVDNSILIYFKTN